MRYLILSDIHSNWEALQSVLAHAEGRYDRILCCGDLAGYGPDPNAVVEWSRRCVHRVIRGNHDRACAALDDLEWFNPVARKASEWTTQQLTEENLEYLRQLPAGPVTVDGFLLAHGSPLDEDEYLITGQDAMNLFGYMDTNLVFFGHTHLQGAFALRKGKLEVYQRPCGKRESYELTLDPDAAYLINPGSVGQPRDSDPRAAYLLFESESMHVTFCRAPYDGELTRRKIIEAGLPDSLGNRLLVGR